MKVERFEQAHELTDGQLVTDAAGELWKITKYHDETWLMHFSDEYAFTVKSDGGTHAHGGDAPLPWSTVKVVPDRVGEGASCSTMCGGCGDMQQLDFEGRFMPHTNRHTDRPCAAELDPDGARRWQEFCAGLDQPELWR